MIDSIAERKMIIEALIGPANQETPEAIAEERAKEAAVEEQAVTYSRSVPAQNVEPNTYSRPAVRVAPQAVEAPAPTPIEFKPGSQISGSWSLDGKLTMNGMQVGSFQPVNGTGAFEFEMGNIRGYTVSPTEGIAFNRDTGESYSFRLKLSDNEFGIDDIRQNPAPKSPAPDASSAEWKGEVKDGKVDLGGGFKLTFKPDGTVDAEFPKGPDRTSDSSDKDSSRDGISYGRGFLDKLGNLFLAFDNGSIVRMNTQQNGSLFQILGYENL